MFNLNNKIYHYSKKLQTILLFSKKVNIVIPHFCYHPLLSISGNCRICMVEVLGSMKPVIACATIIMKGMIIFTNSELVKCIRENILEFLLINHPLDCPICDQAGECDLQDLSMIYGSDKSRFVEKKRSVTNKYFNNIIKVNMTRCINCTRCIRYADELSGVPFLGTMGKGVSMEISNYFKNLFISEVSGNIIDICPVGALNNKITSYQLRNWELYNHVSIDLFDSLNQNILVQTKENNIVRVLPLKKNIINMELITDNARFFYLKMKKNRIFFPFVEYLNKLKINNNTCSWNYSINLFFKYYNENIKSKIIFLDNYIDFLDLEVVKLLSYKLKFFNSNKYERLFNNNRSNWLLNINISTFNKIKNIFFIFMNIKKINSILNINIYNNLINEVYFNIYSIGIFNENIYKFNHLFISMNELNNLYINKLFNSNIFIKNKYDIFRKNNNSNILNKFFSMIIKLNIYSNLNHENHYISETSTEIMLHELSLKNTYLNKKKYSFLYNISTYNNIEINKYFNFIVFQISNYNNYIKKNIKFKVALYLPTKIYYENVGIYYNLFFKKQVINTLVISSKNSVANKIVLNVILEYYNNFK